MGSQLSLSILEIIVLMVGAITLGFTIHFFLVSRRTLNQSMFEASGQPQKEAEAWKLRYFNEIEHRDEELNRLRKQLSDTEENNEINTIEAEETRKLNKQLKAEIEALKQQAATVQHQQPVATAPVYEVNAAGKAAYAEQLRMAQTSLLEQNEKINQLLGQIDIVNEAEKKQEELLRKNEALTSKIEELRRQLSQKEKEANTNRQKQQLSTEMTSMIDSAYNEFHVLQEKIQKLESQVSASKKMSMEYEDMKEGYLRVNEDYEELRRKYNAAVTENKQLLEELTDTEEKLKDATAQRVQLQKRVVYLEELNNDLQLVAEANKKLETQMKRIGELESMLNMISGDRTVQGQRSTKAG